MRGLKRGVALLCAMALLCLLSACRAGEIAAGSSEVPETQAESSVLEEENMSTVTISVGDQTFTAALYDTPAAKALSELLPMTLHMSELNGNEKYFYLDATLPTDASIPSEIHAGDLMLYGNNCLVLFYESFSTSYSYTPLGHIENPAGLASALGNGSVQVTFRKG